MRADSGYRSLENPVTPSLKMIYHQHHVVSSEYDPLNGHRIPSLGESVEEASEGEEGAIIDSIELDRYT